MFQLLIITTYVQSGNSSVASSIASFATAKEVADAIRALDVKNTLRGGLQIMWVEL